LRLRAGKHRAGEFRRRGGERGSPGGGRYIQMEEKAGISECTPKAKGKEKGENLKKGLQERKLRVQGLRYEGGDTKVAKIGKDHQLSDSEKGTTTEGVRKEVVESLAMGVAPPKENEKKKKRKETKKQTPRDGTESQMLKKVLWVQKTGYLGGKELKIQQGPLDASLRVGLKKE